MVEKGPSLFTKKATLLLEIYRDWDRCSCFRASCASFFFRWMLSNLHPFQGLDLHKDERMTAKSIKLDDDDEDISSTSKRASSARHGGKREEKFISYMKNQHSVSRWNHLLHSHPNPALRTTTAFRSHIEAVHRLGPCSSRFQARFPGKQNAWMGPPTTHPLGTCLLPPRRHTCEASRGRGSWGALRNPYLQALHLKQGGNPAGGRKNST